MQECCIWFIMFINLAKYGEIRNDNLVNFKSRYA